MDNVKNDHYFAGKIRDDLTFIVKHMSRVDSEEFANNDLLQDSMMFRLIQISENAPRLIVNSFLIAHSGKLPFNASFRSRRFTLSFAVSLLSE